MEKELPEISFNNQSNPKSFFDIVKIEDLLQKNLDHDISKNHLVKFYIILFVYEDNQNTLYYATNDTGDPENVVTVYNLVFSDVTTATGSIVATGLDDSSGLWYYESDVCEYLFVLESQFGALFGINTFEPPFNIEIIPLTGTTNVENVLASTTNIKMSPNPFSHRATFEIELRQGGAFHFQVFDVNGKNVKNEVLELKEGTNQFTIDGSDLIKGFYSYRLTNKQGFISGKMIVVKK